MRLLVVGRKRAEGSRGGKPDADRGEKGGGDCRSMMMDSHGEKCRD